MATTPSDRQLVVYENNPTNPDLGRLIAIDPQDAKGIPIPTFDVKNVRPVAGTLKGEAVYETSTRQGSVWDGSKWDDITPRAKVDQWINSQSYAANELVIDRGMLWVSKRPVAIGTQPDEPSPDWRLLGSTGVIKIASMCDAADGLDKVPRAEGAVALDRSTGQLFYYDSTQGVWVEQLGGYYGSEVPPALTALNVNFDNTDTPTWGTVPNLQEAIKKVYTELIASGAAAAPVVGEIRMFASTTIPTGWQLCDGSAIDVSKTAAIALFGANTPDLRGEFIRGWETSKAPLLHEDQNTAKPTSGNPVASSASLAVQGTTDNSGEHLHTYFSGWGNGSGISGGNHNGGEIGYGVMDNKTGTVRTGTNEGAHQHQVTGAATGTITVDQGWDSETRPDATRVIYATYIS